MFDSKCTNLKEVIQIFRKVQARKNFVLGGRKDEDVNAIDQSSRGDRNDYRHHENNKPEDIRYRSHRGRPNGRFANHRQNYWKPERNNQTNERFVTREKYSSYPKHKTKFVNNQRYHGGRCSHFNSRNYPREKKDNENNTADVLEKINQQLEQMNTKITALETKNEREEQLENIFCVNSNN
ncbi:hypothetical protein SNEBB_005887 [Seison nebaliae]|nr:hypothetical protein SNEBB_005887 [Seison nebaliae]